MNCKCAKGDNMEILLICGESMTGKTTIMKELCRQYPNIYNPIMSYTTRPKRSEDEYGHIFVDEEKMWDMMHQYGLVARTFINGYFYFTTPEQFVEDKINIYIVDGLGVLDVTNFYKTSSYSEPVHICTALITRTLYDTDEYVERLTRNIKLPPTSEIDISMHNNGDIDVLSRMFHCLVQTYFDDDFECQDIYDELIMEAIFGD